MTGLKVSTAALTEAQAAFCQTYVSTGDVAASAAAAGYSHPQMGYQALRSSAVQAAIRDHLERRVKIEGARVGVDQIIYLAKNAKSEAVRLNASIWLVEAAGFGAQPDSGKDKPMAEMSAAELAALADRLEKRVLAGETPLIRETSPDTGHIPPMAEGDVLIDQGDSE